MTEFTASEQTYLNDLVARRTTSFQRPPWMQPRRERAIKAEARKLIGDSSVPPVGPGEIAHYNAAARIRAVGGDSKGYKIHESGFGGRPICTMGQNADWQGEELGAGPVTCGKCAATRSG